MVFDLTFLRQLEEATTDFILPNWTAKEFRICPYVMIPIGIFLVFLGNPRRKIALVLVGFFAAFALFGPDIISGKEFGTQVEGAMKLIAVGGVLGVITFYFDCITYTVLGYVTALMSVLTFLCTTNQITDKTSFEKATNSNRDTVALIGMAGLLLSAIFREHAMIPFSVLCGSLMIILSLACIDQDDKFYISLYQNETKYYTEAAIAIAVGFAIQMIFKIRERKLNEEIKKQQEEKNESLTAYHKMQTAVAQKPQPVYVPQPVYMNVAPVNMGYSPLLPQATRMNISNNVPRQNMTATVPAPKQEHKSIAEIQANLSKIDVHGSNNKEYEF